MTTINPRGYEYMFARYDSGRHAVTSTIWPHGAPSAQRFIQAFQAGEPLNEHDVFEVQVAAKHEAVATGFKSTPLDWSPRKFRGM